MGRQVLDARLALEGALGTVAVVHVEIEDRHALQAVHVQCLAGADRDAVEQAEAHRTLGFGVMAGRAQRAERIVCLTANERIDGGDRRACGAQPGLGRARRHHGVRIEPHVSRRRLGAQHGVNVAAGVHPFQLRARRPRRLTTLDADQRTLALFPLQHRGDRAHARDRLRMARPGVVLERGRVHVEQRGHAARSRAVTRLCSIRE